LTSRDQSRSGSKIDRERYCIIHEPIIWGLSIEAPKKAKEKGINEYRKGKDKGYQDILLRKSPCFLLRVSPGEIYYNETHVGRQESSPCIYTLIRFCLKPV
jgi:hypothetical protein